MTRIKAMIFAAGLGTRLKPWTDSHPKALAIVNGKSLLQRNIEFLQQYGITNVIVNVHHFPDQIIETINKSKGWGSNVLISDESDEVLETGGGLLKASDWLKDSDLVLSMNADILTDLDFNKMIEWHKAQKALIALAVMTRPASRHLLFNDLMRLCGWRNDKTGEERMPVMDTVTPYSFSGITLYDPSVFKLINRAGKFSLVDLFLDLAPNHTIAGYDHSGDRFIDVGKPGSTEQAGQLFS